MQRIKSELCSRAGGPTWLCSTAIRSTTSRTHARSIRCGSPGIACRPIRRGGDYRMRMRSWYSVLLFAALAAQQQQQPRPYTPTPAERRNIETKSAELGALLNRLERDRLYPDVAI